MATPKLLAVDFEVFGRVQGVFFRKYTKKKAVELGIRGWCKNTEEKTVAGQLEGSHRELSLMKDWLQRTGSPSSRIEKAEFKNEKEIDDYSFKNFSIKH
ncbi:acylphosphatase-2-like isoform X1 [Eriocheir sinensis]|uniref:acylphosphatase-2-like isoform X1 n=1 Tax=Eriocheir sinensis TaxID=95602 RepID=UPI0021C971E0|nr:acylphosphatase-2-like isoform X1 [Eriocheir sinensis]